MNDLIVIYKKGFNCQYTLLTMIEKWKMAIDNSGFAWGYFEGFIESIQYNKSLVSVCKIICLWF